MESRMVNTSAMVNENIKSLQILYRKIEQEKNITKKQQKVIIKSVEKKGNGVALSKKKGEIFFVNIMSKIYVKIKKCNE